jgi:hypothetical protein
MTQEHTTYEAIEQYGAGPDQKLKFCYMDIFKDGEPIASVWMKPDEQSSRDNAAFIVSALNAKATQGS